MKYTKEVKEKQALKISITLETLKIIFPLLTQEEQDEIFLKLYTYKKDFTESNKNLKKRQIEQMERNYKKTKEKILALIAAANERNERRKKKPPKRKINHS